MMELIDFREEATMKVSTEFEVSARTPKVIGSGCQKCSVVHLALDNEDRHTPHI